VLEGFSASPGRRKLRERNATRKTSESSFFADGAISSGTILRQQEVAMRSGKIKMVS